MAGWRTYAMVIFFSCTCITGRKQALISKAPDSPRGSYLQSMRRAHVNPLATVASLFLSVNPIARCPQVAVRCRGASPQPPRCARPLDSMQIQFPPDAEFKDNGESNRRIFLTSLMKGMIGVAAMSLFGTAGAATESISTFESRAKLLAQAAALDDTVDDSSVSADSISEDPLSNIEAALSAASKQGEQIDNTAITSAPGVKAGAEESAENKKAVSPPAAVSTIGVEAPKAGAGVSSGSEQVVSPPAAGKSFGLDWNLKGLDWSLKDLSLGAFAALAVARITQQTMHSTNLENELDLLKDQLAESKSPEARADEERALRAATEATLALKTGQARLDELQETVKSLHSALRSQEAKAATEAAAMKKTAQQYVVEARELLSERDSISNALKKAEANLAAEHEAKMLLEAKLEQQEVFESSLKDSRIEARKRLVDGNAALPMGEALPPDEAQRRNDLQEELSELRSQQNSMADALEALRSERNAMADALEDAELKLSAALREKASLEALRSERNAMADALEDAELKLSAALREKASLEAMPLAEERRRNKLQEDLSAEARRRNQLQVELSALRSEHNAMADALEKAEVKLSAALEAKASLEAANAAQNRSAEATRVADLEAEVATLRNKLSRAETKSKQEFEKRRRAEWQQR